MHKNGKWLGSSICEESDVNCKREKQGNGMERSVEAGVIAPLKQIIEAGEEWGVWVGTAWPWAPALTLAILQIDGERESPTSAYIAKKNELRQE